MVFFGKMFFRFLVFFTVLSLGAVIIQPSHKQNHDHDFYRENTIIMFDVDGVLIDRPVAALNIQNTWSLIIQSIKLFFGSTHKLDLLKTLFTMFKDRSLILQEVQKYDLERIITWLSERYPVLQQQTKSGKPLFVELKKLLTEATPKKESIELLQTLFDKGYKIAIATNQGKATFDHFVASKTIPDFSQYTLLYTSDYGIDSGTNPPEGLIKKPRKQYYIRFKKALAQIDDHIDHYIFIDDTLNNVTQAAKKGVVGIHFTSALQTAEDLNKLGIT